MSTRTYGLSGTGMDVDQLVTDMMKARRISQDALYKKKTQLEWKKTDYNTMYNALNQFRNTSVFSAKLQSNLVPKQVSSTDEAKVTVTANADAVNMSHNLTVHQLADGVKKTSSAGITVLNGDKGKLATQLGIAEGTFDITIQNGTESKKITVDTSKSVYELVSQINSAGINIQASYDSTLDRFFMSTKNTGSTATIKLTDSNNFLADKLHIATDEETGQDAIFALDGVGSDTLIGDTDNLSMASNAFTISGVTYNLKAIGTVKATVSSDTDKAVANVKAFVEAYNSNLAKIQAELNEDKYSSYLPLTEAEKADLKESQLTAWEQKAKSGMLRRDPILQNAISKMRSDISDPIAGLSGNYNNAASIGITTGSYTEGGKLYLDETKLKAALEADPDIAYKILGTNGDTRSKDGIAVRLYDTLKASTDKIFAEAGVSASITGDSKSNLAKQITSYTTRIANMETRLQQIEDRYYKQYDAMEVALNKLNSQSSWLTQLTSTS